VKTKIFVVDDDPNIAKLLRLYLEQEGYEASLFTRGDEALAAFRADAPDLIMLDIMLPGVDGWDVCREVRKSSRLPIIMLSAKEDTFDKVKSLELGADDYITKPFEPKEMIARVKAVLRRSGAAFEQGDTLRFPGLSVSLKGYEVEFDGHAVSMAPKELELLHFLATNQNQVFTREQLLEKVWGFDYFGDSRTVDVHVKRLREKLPDSERFNWHIRTVWSVGYKFEVK
jgi:two-component system OmpR family response regulator